MNCTEFAYAVTRDGRTIETNCDRLVAWWSITKSVLAAATLRLADQGQLSLDACFRDQPFTVRQLLQHTAGVTNYGGKPYRDAVAGGEPVWTVDELLARRNASKLIFAPGSSWSYSNIGYLFVRQLIEDVTETGIGCALKTLVFDPLELQSVRVATQPAEIDETLWGNEIGYDPRWVFHGLLVGTASDAVMFLHKLSFSAFLSEQARLQMMTAHDLGGSIEGRPWAHTGYGLGLMIGEMETVGRACGHSGVGHDTVSALYYFADIAAPATAATFAKATDEGLTEYEAIRIATR